jgi:hypothetical protein
VFSYVPALAHRYARYGKPEQSPSSPSKAAEIRAFCPSSAVLPWKDFPFQSGGAGDHARPTGVANSAAVLAHSTNSAQISWGSKRTERMSVAARTRAVTASAGLVVLHIAAAFRAATRGSLDTIFHPLLRVTDRRTVCVVPHMHVRLC